MAHYRVPGVSVAVVDRGRIVWARGFGVREAGSADSVTPTTLFQAASVSKAIAATATLRLADQGRLDLDADVNVYLRSWRVPENRFTEREKVTLRRILSHRAGLTGHGFHGYGAGEPIPTVLQVLGGQAPAGTPPVLVDTFPGAITRYSGGGTTVQQLLLTDVLQRTFPELMDDLVLRPIGMRNSTFELPLPAALQGRAARGHTSEGHPLQAGHSLGPEMAAGGLWTTPSDLLRWAMAIDRAYDGRRGSILSRRMATQMLTLQNETYGLGPVIEGSGRAFRFGHGGNNPGYLAQLTYFPETGQGAAILLNGGTADLLIDEIMRAIAAEYSWPALTPLQVTPAPLSDVEIARLLGTYAILLPGETETIPGQITRDGDGVVHLQAPPVLEGIDLVPVSATEFVNPSGGFRVIFQIDASGRSSGFSLIYGQTVIPATRVP
jgi:CubicO group peptidase (beta-lactamase class C family)